MITRRLTKTQKAEILKAYEAGDPTNLLAEKYGCTTNTINRTVKTFLSDNEYKLLKEKRSKISNKKAEMVDNENLKEKKEYLVIQLDKEIDNPVISNTDYLAVDDPGDFCEDSTYEPKCDINQKLEENNQNIDNNFELIEPLISSIGFDQKERKSDFEILTQDNLPETVYMIVDKKVELEVQPIADLPEWSFLPDHELKRNAILLFSNQRSAKRSCSRNQRVIKIPNTSVFDFSKSYLVSKGITRLILEDSIIALDN